MQFLTESDLVGVIEGDRQARIEFYDTFEPVVRRIAHTVNHKSVAWRSADDVQNELWKFIFCDSCRLLRKYNGRGPFSHYLASCLSRRCKDIMRSVNRENSRRQSKGNECVSHGGWLEYVQNAVAEKKRVEDEAQESFERAVTYEKEQLNNAVERLDIESRLFIKMLVKDRCKPEILMKAFNLSTTAAVYTRKHRLIAKLRKLMLEQKANAAENAAEIRED